MDTKLNTREYDTLYGTDDRFHMTETDAKLTFMPEVFGSRRVGVAVVGVGRMGAIHLYNILREPRANLLYILDADKNRLAYMQKKYFLSERGVVAVHTDDWQKVMDDKRVEAVLIATPTFTHEKYAKSALENNKHVLCEKPLAAKLEDVVAITKLAHDKGLKLICAFNRRYDPSFRRIQQQVKRGDIGKVRVIKTCSRDSPLPPIEYIRTSGGIFHDCMVHDLDAILWIARELPTEVHTYAHCYAEDCKALNDYDTALITMKFPSGLLGVTDLSRLSNAGYEQRLEAFGPKGVLKLDEVTRAGWEKHNEFGVTHPSQCYSFASRYLEAYANEITELFNHIEGHKTMEPIVPGYLGALCKTIQAIEDSQHSGLPVKINWTADEVHKAFN